MQWVGVSSSKWPTEYLYNMLVMDLFQYILIIQDSANSLHGLDALELFLYNTKLCPIKNVKQNCICVCACMCVDIHKYKYIFEKKVSINFNRSFYFNSKLLSNIVSACNWNSYIIPHFSVQFYLTIFHVIEFVSCVFKYKLMVA